jgi:hypothetical protein
MFDCSLAFTDEVQREPDRVLDWQLGFRCMRAMPPASEVR